MTKTIIIGCLLTASSWILSAGNNIIFKDAFDEVKSFTFYVDESEDEMASPLNIPRENKKKLSAKKKLVTESVTDCVIYDGTATDGAFILTVTKSGADIKSATDEACIQAVYQVLFIGLKQAEGTYSQKPIISDPSTEQSHSDFFNSFFETGGAYSKFVSIIPGSTAAPVKIKGGYKVTVKTVVSKDNLREEMEKNGIIKPLSSGF